MTTDSRFESTDVAIAELVTLIDRSLANFGLSDTDAALIRDVLMYAQLRGKSQGVAKIVERTVEPATDAQPMVVTQRGSVVSNIRCRGEVGMVVLNRAARLAGDAALAHGVGVVSTSHTASSTGSIGYYAEQLARRDCIAIVMAGSPAVMAVASGTDPVMGTNPISIAIPTAGSPLVFDMATSAVTWFELIDAARNGRAIDPSLAWDSDGRATTDPAAAMAGALRTFGGYKGSGLGLMFELLTGPLAGASIAGDVEDNRGNLIIALNPENFAGLEEFKQQSSTLLETIKNGRRADAAVPIRLPGEGARARAEQCLQSGKVAVSTKVLAELKKLASAQPS